MAEWLVRGTHNPMIAGSSLTGASNILGQDKNLVNASAMLLVKRLAMCNTRHRSQGMYITLTSAMRIRQNPPLL